MKKFNYYLKKLLSWSPILRVTDDSKYNKIEKGSVEFRISFVSFTLGIVSYYFFTWKPKEGSKCFHKLNLYDVQKYNENIRKFEIQYDEYLEELKEKDTTNKKVEKEFLSRRISEIETIKGRTFNKFLAYIALFVFIVPLYISKMTISIPKLTTYNIICVLIMSYIIINLSLITYEFIKVKNVKRVTFHSIRKALKLDVENKHLAMLFYEWKHNENESILEVALIKNLEKYMCILIMSSIVIIVNSNFENVIREPAIQENLTLYKFNHIERESFHTFLTENNKKIDMLKNNILSDDYSRIIIISPKNDNKSDDFVKLIGLYTGGNEQVIEVKKSSNVNITDVILIKE